MGTRASRARRAQASLIEFSLDVCVSVPREAGAGGRAGRGFADAPRSVAHSCRRAPLQ